MTVTRTRHIGIVVSDLERSLRFYRDYLGLSPLSVHRGCQGAYYERLTGLERVRIDIHILVASDGSKIELLQFLSHPGRGQAARLCDVGRSHVALSVKDLDDLYRRRESYGVFFEGAPQPSPDGRVRVVFCRDPDGTLVELVEETP